MEQYIKQFLWNWLITFHEFLSWILKKKFGPPDLKPKHPNQILSFFYSTTVSGRDYRPSSQVVARRAKYLQRVLHATNRVFKIVQFKCEVQ